MSESEEVNKAESTLKPRSRFAFLLRPWCLIPVTILTILVAAVLGYRSSRLVGIPPIAEVVDRETEGRFPIEPEQNAFTYYEQALNQMPVLPEKLDPGILCQVLRDKGWEQAASRAVKCLGKCQVSLDLWKRGTTFDHGVRIQPADRNAYDDVSPLMYSNFIRLVILQSTRCLQEGNPEEASSWLRALFRFSRHLGNPGGALTGWLA